MSEKYSSSPTLHLSAGSSKLRCAFYTGLCLCALAAHYLLLAKGQVLLTAFLLPATLALLRFVHRDFQAAESVFWQQGTWTVLRDGVRRPISILPCSTCLPWVIFLVWQELPRGHSGKLWLFADGVKDGDWRQLRRRLALDRRVVRS